MKTIFILYALVLGGFLNAQENPWIPKGENPWIQNPNIESVIVAEKDTCPKVSETVVSENDSLQNQKEKSLDNASSQKELLTEAGVEASDTYNSAKDFGVGFAFGLFFNYFGIAPDLIYIASHSKREKETIKLIEEDSRYDSVNNDKLDKKVRSKIKSKKAVSTLAGTFVGGVVQIGLVAVVISKIW